MEQAYSNSDWAEFYDLWLDQLFGNGPAEDAVVFASTLKQVLENIHANNPSEVIVSILDVGAGTGRVVKDSKDYIDSGKLAGSLKKDAESDWVQGLSFNFTLLEPCAAMLDRAKRHLDSVPTQSFKFVTDSATRINETASMVELAGSSSNSKYHLAAFAASGLNHLTGPGDIQTFLSGLRRTLDPEVGRAVISILKEFIYDGDAPEDSLACSGDEGTVGRAKEEARIRSGDRPEEVYVKYPTSSSWRANDRSIRADGFKLAVEDASTGEVLREHHLGWDVKFLRVDDWERMLADAGFEILGKSEGVIQFWWTVR
jgi:ubiquinone/menaquinone biosynthesis C-methylase UbiE